MRLAKYLARAGIASRRGAEEMISEGLVVVNGLVADKPQQQVSDSDKILVDGLEVVGFEQKRYLLLNKPEGYISTAQDTHNRPIVTELVDTVVERLYPVGRLDADTSGVMLLTNDGELAYRLTHPRYGVRKVYHALVDGFPDRADLKKMSCGIVIEGEKTAPARVEMLQKGKDKKNALISIVLTEGKKRQVKKMCKEIGHPVIKLKRVKFAGLDLQNLPPGSSRELTNQEIKDLYNLVGL